MTNIKTKLCTTESNNISIELYDAYINNKSEKEELLIKIKNKKKFKALWEVLNSIQHDKIVTKEYENHLSDALTTKQVVINGECYTVTLYFIPVSVITLPTIDDSVGISIPNIRPVLTKITCKKIINHIKCELDFSDDEDVEVLSALVSRELIVGIDGLEFTDELTKCIANHKQNNDYDLVINLLAEFDALPPIILTDDFPDDHRVVVAYTLSKNNSLKDKIQSQNTLVNNYNNIDSIQPNKLCNKIQDTINKMFQESKKEALNSVGCTTLPMQSLAFLRLSFFVNSIIGAIFIAGKNWGKIEKSNIEYKEISEYLSFISLSIVIKNKGELNVSQSLESTYRYYQKEELLAAVKTISETSNLHISTSKFVV